MCEDDATLRTKASAGADPFVHGEHRQGLRWPNRHGHDTALLLLTLSRDVTTSRRAFARRSMRELMGTRVCKVPRARWAA